MGRAPCCSKVGLQRGPWTPGEDALLTSYIQAHGEGQWRSLPKKAGLLRCGKSCRLRWMNYLRPDIKRGNISSDEEDLIIRMHSLLGNRWSLIAGRLSGRTDNEIKNYWNTHLAKRLSTTQGRRAQQKKSPQEKKRRKNNTKTSKKSHQKVNKERIVQEKHKIHLPKPVRLTGASRISNNLPRNDSLESNTASCDYFHIQTYYSSSQGGGGDDNINNIAKVNGDDDDINNIGVSFLFGDDDDVDLTSNTVQKVYDEYLKILERDHHDDQLDSFT